jgi:hypothetical protein
MIPLNNNMKKSAAILAFFISAAAWVALEAKQEPSTVTLNSSAQPESSNAGIVLRPLTD